MYVTLDLTDINKSADDLLKKALPNGFPCLLMITKARVFPSLIPTIIDYKSYLISPSKIEFFFSLEMINHQTNEEGRKRKI